MRWSEVYIVFFVCHVFGDFLLQTEWQATHKAGGITSGDPSRRRALSLHVLTYSIAFIPALIWAGHSHGAGRAIGAGALIVVEHFVQDDGTILTGYVHRVKKTAAPFGSPLWIAIDQSLHIVVLFGAALLAAA